MQAAQLNPNNPGACWAAQFVAQAMTQAGVLAYGPGIWQVQQVEHRAPPLQIAVFMLQVGVVPVSTLCQTQGTDTTLFRVGVAVQALMLQVVACVPTLLGGHAPDPGVALLIGAVQVTRIQVVIAYVASLLAAHANAPSPSQAAVLIWNLPRVHQPDPCLTHQLDLVLALTQMLGQMLAWSLV